MNSNLETRSLLHGFDKGGFFDLGHPLLNRIAESFVKAAGIGAVQAVAREAYFTASEGEPIFFIRFAPFFLFILYFFHYFTYKLFCLNLVQYIIGVVFCGYISCQMIPFLVIFDAGETNRKSIEALVKSTGKESVQWGLAAGMYSGLTYGLKEARGVHDWKNSALAGAITGAALALTLEDRSHEQVVQCAITGAAISSAANLLTGIF
uniref:Outer envelope pore protein 16-2, chloroplastic-like n=1 Tax=Nicotiana tabacum TaxID=4097 RepID=A0A1S3YQT0_TOBAC|nr:PREDICTED: outer envelope pore protein 16-2, chloroplastic-like [Nicotiana tabacum]